MGLSILVNLKRDNYYLILIIIDQFMKMVHYKLVKVTIDAPGLAEIIIDVVMGHHSLPNLIITNRRSFFISKF